MIETLLMSWGPAQWIYIGLFVIGMFIIANRHGRMKIIQHNFWVEMISGGIILALLIWGGFFS